MNEPGSCLRRREFLLYGGGIATVVGLGIIPGLGCTNALKVSYPRKKIVALKDLEVGVATHFKYPDDDPVHAASFIVKMGTEAGGGVGDDKDIVAFNALCPHMGGPMNGLYKHEFKAAGPCPLHLTTFDLTRHGMVIAGHATQSLPQVTLEVAGADIYATGLLGLIFGMADKRAL